MSYVYPTVEDFKQYFNRDFPYGNTESTVMDSDIQRARTQAHINCNQELFADQTSFTVGFLLLSAHYLVTNLQQSSQGISGQFSWLQSSRSAGSVSESISIPDRILADPIFSGLSKTNYGAQYLQMILPVLVGPFYVVAGDTLP